MEPPQYFKRELDLVKTFYTFLKCGGLPSQTHVVLEFESGHGIADIVIFGARELFERRAVEFSKIPPRYAVVFGRELLPKKFLAQQFSELTGAGVGAMTSLGLSTGILPITQATATF